MNKVDVKGKTEKSGAETQIRTLCHECYNECGVIMHVRDNRVVRVEGDPEHPFNKSRPHYPPFTCYKAHYPIFHVGAPGRVEHPLKRRGKRGGGDWEQISWEKATEEIAERLIDIKKKYGPVPALAACGPHEWYDRGVFLTLFMRSLGSPNVLTICEMCGGTTQMGDMLVVGERFTRYPYGADYENSKCIFIVASNPAASFPNQWERILEGKSRGAKLIVVDPRESESAREADIYISVRPGADSALGLAMLNVIIGENLYDKEFVSKWCHGFEELRERVKHYPPEKMEKLTWVPAEKIREIARLYATTKPATMLRRIGTGQHTNSVQTARIFTILIAITGNIDIPGGNMLIKDLGGLKAPTEFLYANREKFGPRELLAKQFGADRFPLWSGPDSIQQLASMVEGTRAIGRGDVKALLVTDIHPIISFPDTPKFVEGLKKLELLVTLSPTIYDTATYSDYVLPTTLKYEEDYVYISQYHKTATGAQPVIKPPGEARNPIDVLIGLARAVEKRGGLEYPDLIPWNNHEEWWDARLEGGRITMKELLTKTHKTYPIKYKEYEQRGFHTPTGKVELWSTMLEKVGQDPLPFHEEPPFTPYGRPDLAEEFPFILLTGAREFEMYETHNKEEGSMARQVTPFAKVWINDKSAKKRGINQGDEVIVRSPWGECRMVAYVSDHVHPDVVSAPFGWYYPEKGEKGLYGKESPNINMAIGVEPPNDPNIGVAYLKPLMCNVMKVAAIKAAAE
ncbi:MAG: hypothetical protein FJW24_01250 [Acidimicrobiia bacterium]|nr:hypothetical protein [Acidimicrobiia bacterium]